VSATLVLCLRTRESMKRLKPCTDVLYQTWRALFTKNCHDQTSSSTSCQQKKILLSKYPSLLGEQERTIIEMLARNLRTMAANLFTQHIVCCSSRESI
jgi:hypothetical protein